MIKEIISNLFGNYVPIAYETAEGMRIPDGLAGVDLVFVSGVALFALTFYCVFRIMGVLLDD